MRNTVLFTSLIFFSGCIKKEEPKDLMIRCRISDKSLKDNNILIFSKDGNRVAKGEIDHSSFAINSFGCAIVPKQAKESLVVRSGKHGISIPSNAIPNGFSEVSLSKFHDNFDAWAYCGISPDTSEMVVKLKSELLDDKLYFEDNNQGKKTELLFNEYSCAIFPRDKGVVLDSKENVIEIIDDEFRDLYLIDAKLKESGFLNVCKARSNDLIVKTISQALEEEDCHVMHERISEIYEIEDSIFVSRNIENIDALADLNFKKLNLMNNNIKDISPIQNMNSLQSLNLSNNPIILIRKLPASLSSVSLERTKLKNIDFLNKLELKILYINGIPATRIDLSELSLTTLDAQSLELDVFKINWKTMRVINLARTKFDHNILNQVSESDMRYLMLSEVNLKSLDFLKNFPKVESLLARNNNIIDLSPVSESAIQHLWIKGNRQLTSLKPLCSTKLRGLEIDEANVKNLEDLKNIETLVSLYINNTKVENLLYLKDLEKIVFFEAANAPITRCPTDAKSDVIRNFCLNRRGLR